MNIEKFQGGYRVRMQHDGVRYVVLFDHKPTEVEAMVALTEKMTNAGALADKMLFKQAANKYVEDRTATASPSTLRGYRTIINSLPLRLMQAKLPDIKQPLIQSVINEMAVTRTPKTIRNIHGFIASVLKVYRPDLILNTSLPAKIKPTYYIPSEDDVKKIIEAARGTQYEIAIALGVYGLRRSEVCALNIDDLEGDLLHINKAKVRNANNEWVVRNVNKSTEGKRDIILDSTLVNRINELGYIYKGAPDSISHWLQGVQQRLGMQEFSYHKLRHFYASYAHYKGVPDAFIMQQGGWTSDYVLKSTYRHALETEAQTENKKMRDSISKLLQ